MKDEIKKALSSIRLMLLLTAVIFAVFITAVNVKVNKLEVQLTTNSGMLPVEATPWSPYVEECYKSHIENKHEFVLTKINHDCVGGILEDICVPTYLECEDNCYWHYGDYDIHSEQWNLCLDACSKSKENCKRNLRQGKDEYVLADSFGCLEPAYVRNYTVEVCDAWIPVRYGDGE